MGAGFGGIVGSQPGLDQHVTFPGIHRSALARVVLVTFNQRLRGVDRHIHRQRPGQPDVARSGTADRFDTRGVLRTRRHRRAYGQSIRR